LYRAPHFSPWKQTRVIRRAGSTLPSCISDRTSKAVHGGTDFSAFVKAIITSFVGISPVCECYQILRSISSLHDNFVRVHRERRYFGSSRYLTILRLVIKKKDSSASFDLFSRYRFLRRATLRNSRVQRREAYYAERNCQTFPKVEALRSLMD
jgi:hypothetical protein